MTSYPDAKSPTLIVATPTAGEEHAARLLNETEWRGALTCNQYLAREIYMESVPLAVNGGKRSWILTEEGVVPDARPILSSCETWKKKTLYTQEGSSAVVEGWVYGIGSVYTDPRYRGRGYASRMFHLLRKMLQNGVDKDKQGELIKPMGSVLWSDIGKSFYAKLGWEPHASAHAAFPASQKVEGATDLAWGTITYENLETFVNLDCDLMRQSIAAKTELEQHQFALLPDSDTVRWRLYRDAWIAEQIMPGKSEEKVHGVWAGVEGNRVWAIWSRAYSDDPLQVEKNTLNILRLVIEDESASTEELAASLTVILREAVQAAAKWKLGTVVMNNPTSAVKDALEKSGISFKIAERESYSVPSLLVFGKDSKDFDWVGNEMYGWC
ncbi:hypothetical protein VHEMI04587 [[Torrubiella] hemipterigena]|uniref:LYC1 C-terminal domain-containing protein n=1 Tax=[Torrubiella] hemipterigena TaxID=1531966 RepID=A0A0A1TED2_9HYPO|nr:hypothetical protein VHEMI04587 [[Torrubiella] hemipterigena]